MELKTFALMAGLALAAMTMHIDKAQAAQATDTVLKQAVFSGGCFWCVEHAFDQVDGVVETISGYTGGHVENPDYSQVSAGGTGHAEALLVRYDPARVSYKALLDVFWRNIDPLDAGGQFCDRGSQYRSAIFVQNDEQRQQAEASKAALESSGRFDTPITTQIEPGAVFFPAEDYHQNYHHRNPLRYHFYRASCGRDRRLKKLWGE